MQQSVDATEIDDGPLIDDVLDDVLDHLSDDLIGMRRARPLAASRIFSMAAINLAKDHRRRGRPPDMSISRTVRRHRRKSSSGWRQDRPRAPWGRTDRFEAPDLLERAPRTPVAHRGVGIYDQPTILWRADFSTGTEVRAVTLENGSRIHLNAGAAR